MTPYHSLGKELHPISTNCHAQFYARFFTIPWKQHFLRDRLRSTRNLPGRKNRALQVPLLVSYKALGNFSKALYGATGGTYSARVFRPVIRSIMNINCKTYSSGTTVNEKKKIKYDNKTW